MPYNTTAIPPRKEATGHTQLPLSRVKKIIAVDPDINICSNNAAFVITLAAEMFVQHLTMEASGIAKAERKPRRNIQYKDLSNAVAHNDNLEFLEDVVPRTVAFKDIKDRAAATAAKLAGDNSKPAGKSTEKKKSKSKPKPNGFTPRIVAGADREDRTSPDANDQLKGDLDAVGVRTGMSSNKDEDGDDDDDDDDENDNDDTDNDNDEDEDGDVEMEG